MNEENNYRVFRYWCNGWKYKFKGDRYITQLSSDSKFYLGPYGKPVLGRKE